MMIELDCKDLDTGLSVIGVIPSGLIQEILCTVAITNTQNSTTNNLSFEANCHLSLEELNKLVSTRIFFLLEYTESYEQINHY